MILIAKKLAFLKHAVLKYRNGVSWKIVRKFFSQGTRLATFGTSTFVLTVLQVVVYMVCTKYYND